MSQDRGIICRHCRKAIHYLRNADRWVHSDHASVWCDMSATVKADPEFQFSRVIRS